MGLRNPDLKLGLMNADELDAKKDELAQTMQLQQMQQLAPSVAGQAEQPPVQSQEPSQDLKSMLESQLYQGMQRRQRDNELARMLQMKKAEAPSQVDLTNFYEMAKAGGADKSAGAGYKAPVNFDPMDAQSAIDKNEAAMTDDQMAYLKQQLEAKSAERRAIKDEQYHQHFVDGKTLKLYSDMGSDVEKIVEKKAEFDKTSNTVLAALTPDENGQVLIERVTQVIPTFMRSIGQAGAFSDKEAANALSGSLELMYSRAMAKLDKGETVDQSEIKNMRDTMLELKKNVEDGISNKMNNIDQFYMNPNNVYTSGLAKKGGKAYLDKAKKSIGVADKKSEEKPTKKSMSKEEITKGLSPEDIAQLKSEGLL